VVSPELRLGGRASWRAIQLLLTPSRTLAHTHTQTATPERTGWGKKGTGEGMGRGMGKGMGPGKKL